MFKYRIIYCQNTHSCHPRIGQLSKVPKHFLRILTSESRSWAEIENKRTNSARRVYWNRFWILFMPDLPKHGSKIFRSWTKISAMCCLINTVSSIDEDYFAVDSPFLSIMNAGMRRQDLEDIQKSLQGVFCAAPPHTSKREQAVDVFLRGVTSLALALLPWTLTRMRTREASGRN